MSQDLIPISLLLLGVGGAWFTLRRLRTKLTTLETGQLQNENPEEKNRKQLKRQLLRLQAVDGCELLAERAAEHFMQADERIRSFDRLLRSKLGPSELTFERYRSAAEQVFLSIMDRLTEVAELLTSIEAIRPSEIREKLRSKDHGKNETAFQERLAVADQQQAKAEKLLNENEKALTEMDRANAALTEMKTNAGLANVELTSALKQLEELAERAKRYSIGSNDP